MASVSGGTVQSDGTIIASTGDVAGVVHESPGHYEVNFNSPQAAFVVTQLPSFEADTRDNAVTTFVMNNRTQFIVKTGDSGGGQSDRGFSFMSISD